MPLPALAGLILVAFSAVLLIGLFLLKDRVKASFRKIPAFSKFNKSIGTAVENGTRIHFSLGSADIVRPRTAASFSAISVLRRIVEMAATSDAPPVATAGDASLAILSQDSLRTAYRAAGADQQYQADSGRVTGLTPFSYAAATLSTIYDEDISSHSIMGGFGAEVGLLTDATERNDSFTLAAADSLPAQAVLFASVEDPLIGEDLYVSGAYLNAGRAHMVSVFVQDTLRWLIVLVLLGGATMKLLAGLL
ncbi:MAG: hypothetical protein HN855_00835 [Anaerolineae bacterium]|nr:hypothetical protein [Anaerolineae bacterium]MBT7070804.1 hypothetical protein [Anaerolineae bacterium]MBT7323686.1 hypothetical protein [Anaerolineae bacterium]